MMKDWEKEMKALCEKYKINLQKFDAEKNYTLKELISGINKSNIHREIGFGKKSGNEHW